MSYSPGANPIRDQAGNAAGGFTNRDADTQEGQAERTFLEAYTVDLFRDADRNEHPWFTLVRAKELDTLVLRAVAIQEQIPVSLALHPDFEQIPGARYRQPAEVDEICLWVVPNTSSKCYWFYKPDFAATAWE